MDRTARRQVFSSICARVGAVLSKPLPLSLIVLGSLLWEGSATGQTLQLEVTKKNDNLARISGATLLVGYPSDLWLTRGNDTMHVDGNGRNESWLPSISADGRILAAVRLTGDYRNQRTSITLDTQKEGDQGIPHDDLKFDRGEISISPDGSKLACSRHNKGASWNLQILDLRTGEISLGPEMRDDPGKEISWSPDGRRFAFETYLWDDLGAPTFHNIYAIYIFDLESRSMTQIGAGHSPSWSPSGEWVAFVGYVLRNKKGTPTWCYGKCYEPGADAVSLMKADGTQTRTLMTFRTYIYGVAPVWSPDSKVLLINRSRDAENDSYDIYLLDLATEKRKRIFKNTMPVYAWVKAY